MLVGGGAEWENDTCDGKSLVRPDMAVVGFGTIKL
jgi:hypothetical protein